MTVSRIQRHVTRQKSYTRIRLMGSSNSGKTLSSLYLAQGLTNDHMERVCVLDTERGRSKLFASAFGNRFSTLELDEPYSPERYIEALAEIQNERDDAGDALYDVAIIDSGSHEWNGPGGIMRESDRIKATAKGKIDLQRDVWGQLTPRHDMFVLKCIIQPKLHIIFTTRAKGEYEETEVNGKKKRIKVGLQDIQREGLEYEFTFGFRLEGDHYAHVEKDTSLLPGGGSLFDGNPAFVITPDTGRAIMNWVDGGAGVLIPRNAPEYGGTKNEKNDQRPGAATSQLNVVAPVDAKRAKVLGLFKTAFSITDKPSKDDRDKLVAALGKASSQVFPNGEVLTAFKDLTELQADTLIAAIEKRPDALCWWDIAQERILPKTKPETIDASLSADDEIEEIGAETELALF